jgi:hypothetical protein
VFQQPTIQTAQKSMRDAVEAGAATIRADSRMACEPNASRQRQRREGIGKKVVQTLVLQHHSEQTTERNASVPSLTNTGSNNEDWETASESSDVLRGSALYPHHQHLGKGQDQQTGEKNDTRKSFLNQRPGQSRRACQTDQRSGNAGHGMRVSNSGGATVAGSNKINGGNELQSSLNITANRNEGVSMGNSSVQGREQNGTIHTVCRVDGIVYSSPQKIQQAFIDITARLVIFHDLIYNK